MKHLVPFLFTCKEVMWFFYFYFSLQGIEKEKNGANECDRLRWPLRDEAIQEHGGTSGRLKGKKKTRKCCKMNTCTLSFSFKHTGAEFIKTEEIMVMMMMMIISLLDAEIIRSFVML